MWKNLQRVQAKRGWGMSNSYYVGKRVNRWCHACGTKYTTTITGASGYVANQSGLCRMCKNGDEEWIPYLTE